MDLQGPKIRVGKFENGSVHLKRGQRVVFTTAKTIGSPSLVHVQYARFHQEVGVGNRIYLDDGKLSLVVKGVSGQRVEVEMLVGRTLSDHKGLNLPDAQLSADPITAKDKADLKFGLQEGVDMVALSFTGCAKDVRRLRAMIKKGGGKGIEVIAKIERKQAVKNLEEIAEGLTVSWLPGETWALRYRSLMFQWSSRKYYGKVRNIPSRLSLPRKCWSR